MEKKLIKNVVVLMMIITILATDFFVLGSSLITYAAQVTNEIEGYPNIHFSTYFKEGEKEIKEINKSIKDKELKLYAKIGVNSDVDCLENIQINLNQNNFNLISSNKGSIDGNTVTIEFIAAGSSVEVELGIEPILNDKISANLKELDELKQKLAKATSPDVMFEKLYEEVIDIMHHAEEQKHITWEQRDLLIDNIIKAKKIIDGEAEE